MPKDAGYMGKLINEYSWMCVLNGERNKQLTKVTTILSNMYFRLMEYAYSIIPVRSYGIYNPICILLDCIFLSLSIPAGKWNPLYSLQKYAWILHKNASPKKLLYYPRFLLSLFGLKYNKRTYFSKGEKHYVGRCCTMYGPLYSFVRHTLENGNKWNQQYICFIST